MNGSISYEGLQKTLDDLRSQALEQERLLSDLQRCLEKSPIPIVVGDEHRNIELLNGKFVETFGYTLHDLPTVSAWWQRALPDKDVRRRVMEAWETHVRETGNGGKAATPVTCLATAKDGSHRNLEISGSRVGGKEFFLFIDLTERVRFEEALRASEESFRRIVEASPLGIHLYRLAPDGSLLFTGANLAADAILGLDHSRLVGRPIEKAFPALIGTGIPEQYRRVFSTGEPWRTEHLEICDDRVGGAFDVYAFRTAPDALAVTFVDVTERRAAEERLRASEARFRNIIRNSPLPMVIYAEDKILFANPKAAELMGSDTPEQFIGRSIMDFLATDQHSNARRRSRNVIEGKKEFGTAEYSVVRLDGTTIAAEVTSSRIEYEGQPAVQIIISDLTHRKALQEELVHARKMDAIGMLAGGIAHEFNNALSSVQGNLDLLEMDLPSKIGADRFTAAIRAAASRMTQLTGQLLAYAGGGRYQPGTVELSSFVRESLPILGHAIGPNVELSKTLEPGLPGVEADPTQMQMVLSALLSNASEAVGDRGSIRISVRAASGQEAHGKDGGKRSKDAFVMLSVEDNGPGMSPETLNRVFDPFFTTKVKGRGLGLPAVQGIVRNHGGSICIDSEPGRGTHVRIYLPATSTMQKPPSPRKETLIPGSGTILIIEDEQIIVDIGRTMLQRLGYRVLEAHNGQEALKTLESFPDKVDLALLDIHLPDMDGTRLYPSLKKIRPDLRVLICSGYSIDGPTREILDAGAEGFLQKPFSMTTLSEKIKEVMAAGG